MGSKQYSASRKKLERAREGGDTAKSRDFTSVCSGIFGISVLLLGLPWGLAKFRLFLQEIWEHARDFHTNNMLVSLRSSFELSFELIFWILGWIVFAAWFAECLQVGICFSWLHLAPKWSRLSFFSGLKRILGLREGSESLVPIELLHELLKILIILVVLGVSLGLLLLQQWQSVLSSDFRDAAELEQTAFLFGLQLAGLGMGVMLVLGTLDLLVARWKQQKRLRMDAEELKQELRESEGDAETRGMRKQLHQELLFHGVLEGIRRAKVVIVGRGKTESG